MEQKEVRVLTLLVVSNEYELLEALGEGLNQRYIVSDLDLTGFVNDDGLYRHQPHHPAFLHTKIGHSAQGTKYDPSFPELPFHSYDIVVERVGAYNPRLDAFIKVFMPIGGCFSRAINRVRGPTYQSKWKSLDTRRRKSRKLQLASFSAMFLTATFD